MSEKNMASALDAAEKSLHIQTAALTAFANTFGKTLVPSIELIANSKGMLVVTGLGKTGLIGAKISATLSSTGTPSFFLHAADALHGDSGAIRPDDVLLAISNSGETAEVIQISKMAQSWGSKVIAMTSSGDSTLGKLADVLLQVSYGSESDPLNMAPTTSTLLALAAGDALASSLMAFRDFTSADFKKRHPGGALGATKLT